MCNILLVRYIQGRWPIRVLGKWGAREQWAAAYGQGRGSGSRSNGVCGGSAPPPHPPAECMDGGNRSSCPKDTTHATTLRSELRGTDLLSLIAGNSAVTPSQTEMNRVLQSRQHLPATCQHHPSGGKGLERAPLLLGFLKPNLIVIYEEPPADPATRLSLQSSGSSPVPSA